MVLETTAVHRLCESPVKNNQTRLDELAAIWLVCQEMRSSDMEQDSTWDEAFHCALVAAAGNAELARVHSDVMDRIRMIQLPCASRHSLG